MRVFLDGDESVRETLEGLAAEMRGQHVPFHWHIEFPEVFYLERADPLEANGEERAAYMEAFVGNPPFMGVGRGSSTLGKRYVSWLHELAGGTAGKCDLVAFFFLRSAALLGASGSIGLVSTKTISQGDTRRTAMVPLVQRGYEIFSATPFLPWPGDATVAVALVHLAVGAPTAHLRERTLDGKTVDEINSRLKARPERPEPTSLTSNKNLSYQGSMLLGMGFTMGPSEAEALVASDPRNSECLIDYLGGQELNTHPEQAPGRVAINFGNRSLAEAARYPELLRIVEERVKPERDRNARATYRDNWWLHGERQNAMRATVLTLNRFLACSRVSKHLAFAHQPSGRLPAESLYVFALPQYSSFATLQSRVHEAWALLLSSSMRGDLRYSGANCFETYPFPESDPRSAIDSLETIGEELYETRAAFMVDTDQGLTKTYNALKDPDNDDPRILELRRLHEEMDRAVLDAYGWSDIPVPPYCPKTDADRAALQEFEDEVIDRLYVLNAERYEEEVRLGLHTKKAGKKKGKRTTKKAAKKQPKKTADTEQEELF